MWIELVEETAILNGKEEAMGSEDIQEGARFKANLADECLDMNPRICFAEKIIIEYFTFPRRANH